MIILSGCVLECPDDKYLSSDETKCLDSCKNDESEIEVKRHTNNKCLSADCNTRYKI